MRRRLRLLDGTFAEHGEFVATQPGDGALVVQRCGDPPGNTDQQFVAGRVAQGVVDRFEVVQVQTQHGEGRDVVMSTGDGLLQSVEEVGTVRQAGQAVAKGFPRDFGQQAPVFRQHEELAHEHSDNEHPQRGEHRPVHHKAHGVAQSDRGGHQQRQVG